MIPPLEAQAKPRRIRFTSTLRSGQGVPRIHVVIARMFVTETSGHRTDHHVGGQPKRRQERKPVQIGGRVETAGRLEPVGFTQRRIAVGERDRVRDVLRQDDPQIAPPGIASIGRQPPVHESHPRNAEESRRPRRRNGVPLGIFRQGPGRPVEPLSAGREPMVGLNPATQGGATIRATSARTRGASSTTRTKAIGQARPKLFIHASG